MERIETYFAFIPLTGIRRRIRARVGFGCFGIAAALRWAVRHGRPVEQE
jgi:hypothetical protein